MIYWLQEATTAGGQVGGPSWLLSAGIIGATVSLIGLILAQLRHTQTLRQTRELEDTRRLEARELEDRRRLEARELEAQRAHEAALQKYFEQMRNSLADPKRPLRRSTIGDALSTIARAQTLAVLEGLDPDRKRLLLQFLYESHLIVGKPVISLRGANLSRANLRGADLLGVDLSRVNLSGADLSGAVLSGADLSGANLRGAHLSGTRLLGTNLSETNLIQADLRGAELYGANLSGANLIQADLSGSDLNAVDLRNAYLIKANLSEARLRMTKLSGAQLTGTYTPPRVLASRALPVAVADDLYGTTGEAKGLTQEELEWADGDEYTQLPDHLQRPEHWNKGDKEESEES